MRFYFLRKRGRDFISNSYLVIHPRRECKNAYQCKFGKECKFGRFKSKFTKYVVITGERSDLSGTKLCPFEMPRLYTCWDCKFCDLDPDGLCLNPNRKNEVTYNDPCWGPHHRCAGFTPNDWCGKWDRETGEINA